MELQAWRGEWARFLVPRINSDSLFSIHLRHLTVVLGMDQRTSDATSEG